METMKAAGVTEGVAKSFGPVQAVRGVTLRVGAGLTYGLLGPSGCGKTTLIRLILGTLRPSRGSISVWGHPVPSRAVLSETGYMPQDTGLYTELSARENVAFFARLYGRRGQGDVEQVLDLMELSDRADSPVNTLSGGMQRRVSLACALVHQPRLLLLDEPTVGVDPRLRAAFWGHFHALNEAGTTIIVSSHVMDEAARCHRLVLMRDGLLLSEGTPDELQRAVGARSLEEAFLIYAEARGGQG
jgi:ABC-2 type transport system ATP-binding protein